MDFAKNDYVYFEEVNQGVLSLVGSKLRILDVGCGLGEQGEEFRKRGNYVVGLDVSEHAISVARPKLDEVYCVDVTAEKVPELENQEKFDLIVFADILEHVYNPAELLKATRKYLKPGGRVLISVPNVAVWYVRLGLFFGRFNYTQSGVLDKTHIRFFTKKNAVRLLSENGYQVEKQTITPAFVRVFQPLIRKLFANKISNKSDPSAIANSPMYQFYLKWVFPIEKFFAKLWSPLFAFQFVFLAKPSLKGNASS